MSDRGSIVTAMFALCWLVVPALAFADLVQLHDTGEIWRYTGTPCTATACPGWILLDRNPQTKQIAAQVDTFRNSVLFQRHADGKVWKWDGQTPCDANGCPGWTLIDRNPHTENIVASAFTVFQRHTDGKVWKWDGKSPCDANGCPGWELLDRNPHTKAIVPFAPSLPPFTGPK